MTTPKKHHYIPKMLSRRFTDEIGCLYLHDKNNPNPIYRKTKPGNAFVENHLYRKQDKFGNFDVNTEIKFADLEGHVSQIVDKIVKCSLQMEQIHLNKDELEHLRNFVIYLSRRTPENRPLVDKNTDRLISEIPSAYEAHVNRPITSEELEKINNPDFRKSEKEKAFVSFSGAEPREDILETLRRASIEIGEILDQEENFVIGSRPLTSYSDWFPVHRKVAIRFTNQRRTGNPETPRVFEDTLEIRRINESMANRSTYFAGPSCELIKSLACSY